MKAFLLALILASPVEYRVYYEHANRSWEHLGAWPSLSSVPSEWQGIRQFVIIREQRVQ
jgi:hypothetical protein